MDFEKMFENTSTLLPSEVRHIRAVKRNENRYEKTAIEKAGYELINREGNVKVGYLTLWKQKLSPNILMFVEKPDGFFYYGGIMTPSKK